MIVFRIHCNFFIASPIWLKTCRSNGFSFLRGKMCALEKSGASHRFCAPDANLFNLFRPGKNNM